MAFALYPLLNSSNNNNSNTIAATVDVVANKKDIKFAAKYRNLQHTFLWLAALFFHLPSRHPDPDRCIRSPGRPSRATDLLTDGRQPRCDPPCRRRSQTVKADAAHGLLGEAGAAKAAVVAQVGEPEGGEVVVGHQRGLGVVAAVGAEVEHRGRRRGSFLLLLAFVVEFFLCTIGTMWRIKYICIPDELFLFVGGLFQFTPQAHLCLQVIHEA